MLPWTIRNYVVTDGALIPISVQDGAAYGTFNDESANDPTFPYAWRLPPRPAGGARRAAGRRRELRSELQEAAFDYIGEHPLSVLEAFYWNGLTPVLGRPPARDAVAEAAPEGARGGGRDRGIAIYYVILRRPGRALAPAAATHAGDPGAGDGARRLDRVHGRERDPLPAPLEPLLAILAVAAVAPGRLPRTTRRRGGAG